MLIQNSNPMGKTRVLFPGAFRPPHQAHYETVACLAAQPEIDEVIIIITDRCRHIPGMTKVLSVSVAEKIWAIYLQNCSKIRFETASGSAVKHALAYFEQAEQNDTLLFCAGEDELAGAGRFRELAALSLKTGVNARVIASPVSPLLGGATAVRQCLAEGARQREAFYKLLPTHLSLTDREQVWSICCAGMQNLDDVVKERISTVMVQHDLGEVASISRASSKLGNLNETYTVQLKNGQRLFVKSVKDTVKAAKLGQKKSLKPRNRVYAEKNALKWLIKKQMEFGLKLPEVIFFDNASKTLMLSEVCPGGISQQQAFKRGNIEPQVAGKTGQFLKFCHGLGDAPPFWGNYDADFQHWQTLLSVHTSKLDYPDISTKIREDLIRLKNQSLKSSKKGVFHLQCSPKNIKIQKNEIGIIDFEFCSSIADPAYDLGLLLGHFIYWGCINQTEKQTPLLIEYLLQSYYHDTAQSNEADQQRIIAFIGATLIDCLTQKSLPILMRQRLLKLSATLLSQEISSIADCIELI